ncbi:MAG TPA: hypothetical protein VFL19_05855 [Nitrospira sp.]|nr:hypothetical protein [Nitrospira sp.]
MNLLQVFRVLCLYALVGGCANVLIQNSPRASIGDFTDHVLEPLALRVADEKITEAAASLRAERAPKAAVQTLATLLSETPWIGKLLNVPHLFDKAQLEEDLAWLETRRMPLKRELLQVFVTHTRYEGDAFTVCVDGVQRRYQALDVNRFTRLDDGPGPCELKRLYSLNRA